MNNKPLVSVIVPAYNHEGYILEALSSVINQTYKDIELIIINDGSTDNTQKKIADFIETNKNINIKFFDQKNMGVCKTLNTALEFATGDYIALLASDDFWLPRRLEKTIRFLEDNRNIALVFTDCYFQNYDKITDQRWTDYKGGFKKYFKNGIQNANIYNILLGNFFIPALTVLIRSNILKEKIGFFDEALVYEDLDMWLRIADSYPIGYISEPLAVYRIHGSNLSNNSLFMLKGIMQTIVKHFRIKKSELSVYFKIKTIFRLFFSLIINKIKKIMTVKKI